MIALADKKDCQVLNSCCDEIQNFLAGLSKAYDSHMIVTALSLVIGRNALQQEDPDASIEDFVRVMSHNYFSQKWQHPKTYN